MGDQLRIYTLGQLLIERDDAPVTNFISRKAEALLVYLAYEPGEHSRIQLAELLWDDLPQDRVMANLRMALSNLQQILAPFIVVSRYRAAINAESRHWVDAAELETQLDAAEHYLKVAGQLSPTVAKQMENALELYKGNFLANFSLRSGRGFEEWQVINQEHLHQRVLRALQLLVDHAMQNRRYTDGIRQARHLIQLDPLTEQNHQELMLLLARADQRSAALAQYEVCRQTLQKELGIRPSEETRALYEEIASGKIEALPYVSPPSNLPSPLTAFVPRPDEMAQIAERLTTPECRLLTLVGLGGVGKTRLALQTAAEQLDNFQDGAYFVPLSSVQNPNLLAFAIADALNLDFKNTRDISQQLTEYLHTKAILLVLDNFEHLLEDALLLDALLKAAPRLKLLVTSRERLDLYGEWMVPIEGMNYPINSQIQDWIGYGAVQLFIQSVQRIHTKFSVEASRTAIVELCHLVEGVPLSLELAASWAHVIDVGQIVQQVNNSLDFLTTTSRSVPERHRSIHAVFDQSWRMLSLAEQEVLRKLSVFRGTFTLNAAEKVACGTPNIIAQLLEKSLIRRRQEDRYDMHEQLRQYNYEHLIDADETRSTHDSHLQYYIDLAASAAPELRGANQIIWLNRLEGEHDNIRTAMAWALDSAQIDAALRIEESIWLFWQARGHMTEARNWMEQTLAKSEGTPSVSYANVLHASGFFAWAQGDRDVAEKYHKRALEIRQALNDQIGISGSLNNLGILAWSSGRLDEARVFYEQSIAIRRATGFKFGLAVVLGNLGLLFKAMADYSRSDSSHEEALALYRELEDLQGIAVALNNLGVNAYDCGDYGRACILEEESLDVQRRVGDREGVALLLHNLAELALIREDYTSARAMLEESLTLRKQLNDKQGIAATLITQGQIALAHGEITQAERLASEGVAILRAIADSRPLCTGLLLLADCADARGEKARAGAYYQECFQEALTTSDKPYTARSLICLTNIALYLGETTCAIELLAAAERIRSSSEFKFPPQAEAFSREIYQSARQQFIHQKDQQTAETAYKLLWEGGQTLTNDELIERVNFLIRQLKRS